MINRNTIAEQIATLDRQQREAMLIFERCEGALQVLRPWLAQCEQFAEQLQQQEQTTKDTEE